MIALFFGDRPVDIAPGETVLEALERAGINAPHSCRAGQCQRCLHRAIAGRPTARSQEGLGAAQKALGYFLPCVCVPDCDLTIVRPDDTGGLTDAVVREITKLAPDVVRLRLDTDGFVYRAGQFLDLVASDELRRNYSLASLPAEDPFLEMHIRLHEHGRMSALLRERLAPGDRLHIAGPSGACFYEGVDRDQPLTLIGAGTGLAPLYGVLRDALSHDHRGPIRLYHGARNNSGLYLREELERLAASIDRFEYLPCTLQPDAPYGGDVAAFALANEKDWADTAFFLCGGANLVNRLKRDVFLRGASLAAIRADAFTPSRAS